MIRRTLSREIDQLMHFGQLLVCQRRPKIPILLIDQIQGLLHDPGIQAIVAHFAAPAAHQPFGSLLAVGSPQPLDLPGAQSQQTSRFFLGQPFLFQPLHDFQSCDFSFAHRQ